MRRFRSLFLAAALVAVPAALPAAQQVSGPPGWEESLPGKSAMITFGSYRYKDGSGNYLHVVTASGVSNYRSLDEFKTKNRALLKRHKEITVISERDIRMCGDRPAWDVTFSEPVDDPKHPSITQEVVAVEHGITYITTYYRRYPQARSDAEEWIHRFCRRARS